MEHATSSEVAQAVLEARYDTAPIGTGQNWVTTVGGLPLFIRAIAHALIRNGHSESEAIQLAVGVVQNWASGQGHVTEMTRAKAAAALAEWEAKKAASHLKRGLPMADQGNYTTPNAADLNTAAKAYCAAQGWAMSDGSYPIRPLNNHGEDDLKNAIRAVGRGSGSHDAIRQHIIARAKALGMSNLIPSNWTSSGTRGATVMAETERRFTPGLVELRSAPGSNRIGGYAAVFDKLSRNLGGFVERVDMTAFNQSRAAGWSGAVARYNHDPNMLLGTTAGRTLDLAIDNVGLDYSVLPPTARADILELVQRGDVQHSSFAFRVPNGGDEWTTTDQGYPMRSLNDVQLVDVAPVLTPAYPDATAAARSLEPALASFAANFDAEVEEVRALAGSDELRRFFVRTDKGAGAVVKPKIFGPQAAVQLLARRTDPWS